MDLQPPFLAVPLYVEQDVMIAARVVTKAKIKIVFLIFWVFKIKKNCLVYRNDHQEIQRYRIENTGKFRKDRKE